MSGGGEYRNFKDMIDGGGAGARGQEFTGGGLLSLLANAVAKPLGSQQRGSPQPQGLMPQAQRPQPRANPVGLLATSGAPADTTYTVTRLPESAGVGPTFMAEAPKQPEMPNGDMGSPEIFIPAPEVEMSGYDPAMPPMAPFAPRSFQESGTLPRNPSAESAVDDFEAYLGSDPRAAPLIDMMQSNPDAAQKLFLQWVANGKRLPGMQ